MRAMRPMLLLSAMLAIAWLLLPPRGAEAATIIILFVAAMVRVWRVSDAMEFEGSDNSGSDSGSEILREGI